MKDSARQALAAKLLGAGVKPTPQRLQIAQVLLDKPQHTAVNEGLARFKGTVLFTSHDHELIQTVANKIIEIDEVIQFNDEISYEDYLKKAKKLH